MKNFVDTLSEEQKQALLEALNKDKNIVLAHVDPEVKEQTKNIISEDFTMKQQSNSINKKRKEPVRARENLWKDTGEAKDIITPEIKPPTPRTRKPPTKVELQCHICNKKFETDKRFVFGEYNRCDRCASKK
jgi:DNA-directed RNA polymerase subunit RPC12/RpoP